MSPHTVQVVAGVLTVVVLALLIFRRARKAKKSNR